MTCDSVKSKEGKLKICFSLSLSLPPSLPLPFPFSLSVSLSPLPLFLVSSWSLPGFFPSPLSLSPSPFVTLSSFLPLLDHSLPLSFFWVRYIINEVIVDNASGRVCKSVPFAKDFKGQSCCSVGSLSLPLAPTIELCYWECVCVCVRTQTHWGVQVLTECGMPLFTALAEVTCQGIQHPLCLFLPSEGGWMLPA